MWIIARISMGSACILNARRCGRTHCRYTRPYYLAMIVPVLLLAECIASAGFYGWLMLAVIVIGGSKINWWATERAWGTFFVISGATSERNAEDSASINYLDYGCYRADGLANRRCSQMFDVHLCSHRNPTVR